MVASEWARWLAAHAPCNRDAALEERLGIAEGAPSDAPGDDMIGYHAGGVAAIVRALVEVPVSSHDVVIDIGAGSGK